VVLYFILDMILDSPWNEYWFLVLWILHSVRGEFPDDVSGPAAASETSSGNLPRTPCKISKTKNRCFFFFWCRNILWRDVNWTQGVAS
jgi:hypothetical protein